MGSLTLGRDSLILPVSPSNLGRDRLGGHARNAYWHLLGRGGLPTESQIKASNARTLRACAGFVVAGHLLTLFPTGRAVDATREPWQRGIGKVIKSLPEEERDAVGIVPFRFDDFSWMSLAHTLVRERHGTGARPPAQTIVLRLGRSGTPEDLLGSRIDEFDDKGVAQELRRQFVETFGKPRRQTRL